MGKHKALDCIAHSNTLFVCALRELHTDEPFPSFRGSPKAGLSRSGIDTDGGEGGTDGVINSVGAARVHLKYLEAAQSAPT